MECSQYICTDDLFVCLCVWESEQLLRCFAVKDQNAGILFVEFFGVHLRMFGNH